MSGTDRRQVCFPRWGYGLILLLLVIWHYQADVAQAASFNVACNDIAGLIAAINSANGNGETATPAAPTGLNQKLYLPLVTK